MTRLRAEPASAVRSLEELRAVAITLKRTAADRYEQLAISVGNAGMTDLAAVCRGLASDAAKSFQDFETATVSGMPAGCDLADLQGRYQSIFEDEGLATASPQLISPYRVLSTAVRNTERAFAFWGYVAAHAVNAEIRNAAETMAHGELEHVAALRRERRAAFHQERSGSATASGYDTSTRSLMEAEQALMVHFERMAIPASPPSGDRRAEFTHDGQRNIDFLETQPELMTRASGAKLSKDGDALAVAEFLAEAYVEAADGLREEHLVAGAQRMAGRAIERLAWLRDCAADERRGA